MSDIKLKFIELGPIQKRYASKERKRVSFAAKNIWVVSKFYKKWTSADVTGQLTLDRDLLCNVIGRVD